MQLTSPQLRPLPLSFQFLSLQKQQQHQTQHNTLTTLPHSLLEHSLMDTYEATKTVFSRIQALDPDNASKIMGFILIQDQGDEEMIRLAHGPDSVLFSLINQAKEFLGLSSNTSSSHSAPSSPSPFSPTKFGSFPQCSPRIAIPNNGLSSSSSSSLWSAAPRSPLSYAAVVNGGAGSGSGSGAFSDQLAFLDDGFDPVMSPSGKSDSLIFPYEESPDPHHLHRRRCSVGDGGFVAGSDDSGGGGGGGGGGNSFRPCMYYGRGLGKNGSDGSGSVFGSPNKIDASFDDLVRMKALQQQRFTAASQFMASGAHNPFSYNKFMNILNDNPRSAPAAFMMGEELRKFGRCRPDASDFSGMGLAGYSNSCSRQIYLTFPADSTFSEEDVSNYFSLYGPVQDVRIPYQQKRMFGFVTFVYPETVKRILAKGNPHFVCDSRVLVKPYKEKGNIPDKKQQHQHHHMDRGKFGSCLSPSGLDSLEPHDLPFGPRMFYNNSREAMLRRKLEQEAELQQALELQGRRMVNLQLVDHKNHHKYHQFQPSSYPSVAAPSATSALSQNNQSLILDVAEDNLKLPWEVSEVQEDDNGNEINIGMEQSTNLDKPQPNESLEHTLPDSLFAYPPKSAENTESSSPVPANDTNDNSSNDVPALNMPSLQSCSLKMPKLTSGQEAIEV